MQSGQRIYYTGDMANMDGWFVATDTRRGDATELVEQGGDNRTFFVSDRQVGNVYMGHCDPRFVTEQAYMAYRKAIIEQISTRGTGI